MDETYEEEDIFFGPISTMEDVLIKKLGNRKTRYLGKAVISDDNELESNTANEALDVSSGLEDSDMTASTNLEVNFEEIENSHKEGNANTNVDLETCNSEEEALVNINVDLNDKFIKKFDVNNSSMKCDKTSENLLYFDNSLAKEVNSPMRGLENENFDLNEMKVNEIPVYSIQSSTSSENVKNFECMLKDNLTNEVKVIQEECGQISDITLKLKNSLFLEKKDLVSSFVANNLNKPNICSFKRESYFTNLEVINVNNETLGADCMDESLISDLKNLSEENMEHIQVYCTLESKTHSTLEANSNCDNPNNGLLISQSLSLDSSLENNEAIELEGSLSEIHLGKNVNIKDMSIGDEDSRACILSESNTPSDSHSCPSSPEQRFNDTIEEMELLLARGIDYYKDLGMQEESIVRQSNEHTISSSNSVNSFNPNFDSTHASAGNISKEKVHEEPQDQENQGFDLSVECIPLSKSTDTKKVPPEKPPRIMVTEATPQLHFKQLPSNLDNLLGKSSKTNVRIHSPIVKTATKSKIENSTPKCISVPKFHEEKKILVSKRLSPTVTPRTTFKYGLSTPSSNQYVKKVSPATPNSCNRHPVNINATPKSKIPRLTPPKNNQVFCTPQNVLPHRIKSTVCKSAQQLSKHRTLNIVSPVMKYLQDNPPPPLVTTVKPRYKLSPSSGRANIAENKATSSSVKREQLIKRINEDMNNIAQKVTCKSPLNESNSLAEKSPILPQSMYLKGENFTLNKENVVNKRIISSDRPPVYILKHKGRMRVPKDAVEEKDSSGSSSGVNRHEESPSRTSLMEVSIYEQHSVRHANTLK